MSAVYRFIHTRIALYYVLLIHQTKDSNISKKIIPLIAPHKTIHSERNKFYVDKSKG